MHKQAKADMAFSEEELKSTKNWTYFMQKGEFARAWGFSDRIIEAGLNRDYENMPRHYQCIWDGKSLNGKRVLVRCYHGLGDTIQFIRYMPLLKKIAQEVIVWVQPELIELVKSVDGIDKILALHDGKPDVDFDADIEIMELPHIFRTDLYSIPSKVPYLTVDSNPIFKNENPLVGLLWQAGNWNQSRNISFQKLKALFEIESIDFLILQENAIAAGWESGYGIHSGNFNLNEYARIIKSLDLLISVDSMPAHLAGALNVPVWLLLHHNSDWRWMENRIDSPWYPSLKLFRQKESGAWDNIIENVKNELNNYLL